MLKMLMRACDIMEEKPTVKLKCVKLTSHLKKRYSLKL